MLRLKRHLKGASEQSCDWCGVISREHQPDVQKSLIFGALGFQVR